LVCVGLRRIVTVAFLRRVQIFLLTYLLTYRVRVYLQHFYVIGPKATVFGGITHRMQNNNLPLPLWRSTTALSVMHHPVSQLLKELCLPADHEDLSLLSDLRHVSSSFPLSPLSPSITPLSLSSDRQHLSYDVCLEVRGEIIRTVLCCIVYWSCAQS